MSFIFEALEPTARKRELVGSFSLLVAAAVFVIPYERMGSQKHPLHKAARDVDLFRALKSLRGKPFITAPFWNGASPNAWRFSRIMSNANNTLGWVDEEGHHPMTAHATNSVQDRKADDVLRVIRNALAHGNIVYLNESGFEERGTKLQFLGFLSRYEETDEQKAKAETYRLVTTMLIRLTPKSTRFGDDFVGTVAHWMLAGLSPLHFGCCHEPVYSASYVGATACPLIPSNDRNALNG